MKQKQIINIRKFEITDVKKSKAKLSCYRPEKAHGRSGRLRPRIFLTFGTGRW
jgi:hypothetical protein